MNTDYEIPAFHLIALMEASQLSYPDRYEALRRHFKSAPGADPLWLFAQFMGLANAVAANCRTMAEDLLIEMGDVHPYTAEKVNMPAILGALGGAAIAASVDQKPLCDGCAFRLGSVANTCSSTVTDAAGATDMGHDFMCHIRGYENGEAKAPCAGYVQMARKEIES